MKRWKHRLSEINPDKMTAFCSNCGNVKIYTKDKRRNQFQCINKFYLYRLKHKNPSQRRRAINYFMFMGTTPPKGCEICGKIDINLNRDHNHKTEEKRGFLCSRCNFGLSYFDDDIEILKKAIKYLSLFQ